MFAQSKIYHFRAIITFLRSVIFDGRTDTEENLFSITEYEKKEGTIKSIFRKIHLGAINDAKMHFFGS